jgi:VWFA-related protein
MGFGEGRHMGWSQRCWLSLLLVPMLACAQETAHIPTPGADSTLAGVEWEGRIHLDVTVTDKAGKAVSGLASTDLTLLDNGQPAKIVSFSAFDAVQSKPDPAAEIILVIDAANHTKDQTSDEQLGIQNFLRQNGGHLAQPVEIYRLSDMGLSGTAAPSTDGNALAEEVAQKSGLQEIVRSRDDVQTILTPQANSPSFRNPSFHPQSALRALGSIALIERRKPGRKLMVWVGYSGPVGESSFEWITEFLTRLRQARISLFGVTFWQRPDRRFAYAGFLGGVRSPGDAKAGNLAFEVLAEQSGGSAMEEPDNDLTRLIDKCVQDASVFYTISFDAPRTEQLDDYHALSIEVDKPGVRARTNAGYYDQPVYYDQVPVPAERVTVDELEKMLKNSHGESEAELARKLSYVELSERMSSARLLSWKSRVHGAKAWTALVALADASAFLAPPAAEILVNAAPDQAAQQEMLKKTSDYVRETIPKLPDFYATRTTARFEQPPGKEGQTWKTATGEQSLRQVGRWEATVHYRNGFEEVDAKAVKGKSVEQEQGRLKTRGTFGPILIVVLGDAARSELAWSRWERGADGPLAVFRYRVPGNHSEYEVSYGSILADGVSTGVFRRATGYHGEITIDPASGAVLRLTGEADLEPNLPIDRFSILVEYGPVEIGGGTHICLLRSVAIARVRKIFNMEEWGEAFTIYGPFENMLDDVAFEKYHMFHGEARVLSGFEDVPEKK